MLTKECPWTAVKHALPSKKINHQPAEQVSVCFVRHSAAWLGSSELQHQTWAVGRQDRGMSGSAYQPEPAYVRRLEQRLVLIMMCVHVCVCVFVWEHGNCSVASGMKHQIT